jgi:hypothetical protein
MPRLDPSAEPFEFQARDFDLLRELFESRVMTARHIATLYFNGKREATKKRLQKLKARGFIGERRRKAFLPAALFLTQKSILLLKARGVLNDYPALDSFSRAKRSSVSDLTIHHELEVMDVKTAFYRTLASNEEFSLDEFTTWPLLCQFEASRNPNSGGRVLVKPDGFLRILQCSDQSDYSFFLELDRSSETLDTLVSRANCYLDFYRTGSFAVRSGGERQDYKDFPFRVLMVFKNVERRNNIAERLLQNRPPILRQVYLSTFDEVTTNPLGPIWVRPIDYKEATKGTAFEPREEPQRWGYKRQSVRELLVENRIRKSRLLEDEHEVVNPVSEGK